MMFEEVNLFVLNKLYNLTGRVGKRVRNIIIIISIFSVAFMFSLFPQSVWDSRRMAFGTAAVLILTIFSVDRELKPVYWRKPIVVPLAIFAIGLINISFIHTVGTGYILFAADLVLLFPALYITWINRGDYESLVDITSVAVLIAGLCSFFYTLYLLFSGEQLMVAGRFCGAAKNPNYYGMIGLSMFLSSEYLLIRRKNRCLGLLGIALCAGLGISMMIMSVSRTSMISASVSLIILLIYQLLVRRNSNSKEVERLIRIIAVLVIVACSTACGIFIQTMLPERAVPVDEKSISANLNDNLLMHMILSDSQKIKEASEDEEIKTIGDRFGKSDDINSYSSGRIGIWQEYISHFNMLGNDYDGMDNGPIIPAHNNFIDYTYRCGIPIGLMYLLFYIIIVISAITALFNSKHTSPASFWTTSITLTYALYALVEVSTLPFTRYIPYLFFLSIAPLVGEKKEA